MDLVNKKKELTEELQRLAITKDNIIARIYEITGTLKFIGELEKEEKTKNEKKKHAL